MLVVKPVFSQIFMPVIDDVNWTPSAIFYGGEPGVWYDPSDLTTLFQDSAGTTPVTAVGQTVGRILDKSGRDNHATQATLGFRPTYSARYNRYTYSEQFDNGVWAKTGAPTISANAVLAPNGTMTADTMTRTGTGGSSVNQTLFTFFSSSVRAKIYAKAGTENFLTVQVNINSNAIASFYTINLTDGSFGPNNPLVGTVNMTPTVTSAGNGWWLVDLIISGITSDTAIYYGSSNVANSRNGTIGGSVSLWGADARAANEPANIPIYQRVVSGTGSDYDAVGFTPYLSFDGVDDGMVTGTITPATNKVQVFAGVQKLSDATAFATLVEFSASVTSNNGAFLLSGRSAGAAGILFQSKGTSAANSNITTAASPITEVISGIGDIAAPLSQVRVNQVNGAIVTTTQGTGNYLAYPLYIGRRGGTTTPLSMRLYSLIVRFGANLSTGQITSTESWVNSKTGAY